jgi:hypothetical protein
MLTGCRIVVIGSTSRKASAICHVRSVLAVVHDDHFEGKRRFTRLFHNLTQQPAQVLLFVEGGQDHNDARYSNERGIAWCEKLRRIN